MRHKTKLIDSMKMRELINSIGLEIIIKDVIEAIKEDLNHWDEFAKSPRHAVYVPEGVLELMPIANKEHYTYKYVNGHPNNPDKNLLTIFAYGGLMKLQTGFPLLLSEMVFLTAIRTAATCALATEYLANLNHGQYGIVGCGAQSEFQVIGHYLVDKFDELYYYDIDPNAMKKFAHNLKDKPYKLIPVNSAQEMLDKGVRNITLCTSNFSLTNPVLCKALPEGTYIDGMGGDSEEKHEVSIEVLRSVDKIVIEYFPQTFLEGEIKLYKTPEEAKKHIYASLWELVQGKKPGRTSPSEINFFDSVGFAIEDFSILKYFYNLVKDDDSVPNINLIDNELSDVKNLFETL